MAHLLMMLIVYLLCAGCSQGPAININLVGIPEGTQVLLVNRWLNSVMEMEPRIFTRFDPPKIRLRMPEGATGTVRLVVDAVNETADRMRCTLASGEAVVIVADADVEVTIELRPNLQMSCKPIDPPQPDMSMPDLCSPVCPANRCEVSDGCGGTCQCSPGLRCDSPAKTCIACVPNSTQKCDACPPASAFGGNLNRGMQTCGGGGQWGACGDFAQMYKMDGSHPGFTHHCEGPCYPDGPNYRCTAVRDCFVQRGPNLALPSGSYRLTIEGATYKFAQLSVDVLDVTDMRPLGTGQIIRDDTGFVWSDLTFTVPGPDICHPLELRIWMHGNESIRIGSTTITRL